MGLRSWLGPALPPPRAWPCAPHRTPAFRAAGGRTRARLGEGVVLLPEAIEGFALMVKQTAQILQSFGTELAETELPNDVQSTSSVLCAHTEKKDRVKVRVALCGTGTGTGIGQDQAEATSQVRFGASEPASSPRTETCSLKAA